MAPRREIISSAIQLGKAFQSEGREPADRVLAAVDGTIIFEWFSDYEYQEIEITDPGRAELRWLRKGSDVAESLYLAF